MIFNFYLRSTTLHSRHILYIIKIKKILFFSCGLWSFLFDFRFELIFEFFYREDKSWFRSKCTGIIRVHLGHSTSMKNRVKNKVSRSKKKILKAKQSTFILTSFDRFLLAIAALSLLVIFYIVLAQYGIFPTPCALAKHFKTPIC